MNQGGCKVKRLIILCVITSLMPLVFAAQSAALEPKGTMLPDVMLPSTSGELYKLKELCAGKITMLVYWSVTCPHCIHEMPALLKLNQRLAGNPFQMITISTDSPDMIPAVQSMAEDFGLPDPVLMDMGDNDALPVAEHYDIMVTPTLLILDRSGKLIHSVETEADIDQLAEMITAAF
jgi:peroxiredoxin